jgi:hypothetical protein
VNKLFSHLHRFCAPRVSRGLATRVIFFSSVTGEGLDGLLQRGGPASDLRFVPQYVTVLGLSLEIQILYTV